ncbi:guanyl-specific ribonuclease Sa [Actinoplanes campanulatus]|uniref:Guanyl-specific ribonuclease Sa n=1 Tax=Actinoplanes campanulatus TaxID=113559 RepID=A0A7W5FGI6_9ACTN|nr:ribonuclease domain-containing protein [Actinoplanes campanulatus]MBB3097450.1 guanyl-specific ribonuclease Sa [Actinoplanes campanulatus]GGN26908.1 ribonuclease N1 [Actinoplanes campanulatus]GID38088.1 ribonuclease N1 [Actinoplanes campanulatus]
MITRIGRFLSQFALVFALAGTALAAPAVVAPTTTDAAYAAVYSSCTISRCSAARTAFTGWQSLGWPTTAGWYSWPYGNYNYTGGRFYNREGQLPSATYSEYDVYSRNRGAARDAYRIVVNRSTRVAYFTPDHYVTFYKL